jgi:hypothetical protein
MNFLKMSNLYLAKLCRRFSFLVMLAVVNFGTLTSLKADITYNFVEAGSSEVVAVFELDVLPAFGSDILSISFTEYGNSLFGFGPSYNNDFGPTGIALVDDGAGGLQGSNNLNGGQMGDSTPPPSSLEVTSSNGTRIFLIEPTDTIGQDRLAFISTGRGVNGSEIRIRSDGDFRLVAVPEPSSLIVLGILGGLLSIRRNRA